MTGLRLVIVGTDRLEWRGRRIRSGGVTGYIVDNLDVILSNTPC